MRRRSKFIPSLAAASQVVGALVLVALSAPQGVVQAAGTLIDVVDGTELRQAVTDLNNSTNGANGSDGDADTITLTSAGPYVLDCGTNESLNADGDLDYTASDDLTITFAGPGRATIEIDQSGAACTTERVIHHRGMSTLSLERVRITGGDLSGISTNREDGGGIVSDRIGSTLVLTDVAVEGNQASTGVAADHRGGRGGGVAVTLGTATITDSVISNNQAGDSILGSFGAGVGGGIFAEVGTTLTLVDTTVRSNQAGDGGDSVAGTAGRGAGGGGIYAGGAMDITGGSIGGPAPIDGNTAGNAGLSATGFDGTFAGAGGGIYTTGAVTINGTTIANNDSGMAGAGDAANGGDGGDGGGVFALNSIDITNALIFGNTATAGGDATGGDGGEGGDGGGVYVAGSVAVLTMSTTEVTDNRSGDSGSGDSGAGIGGARGGGVFFGGLTLTITSSLVGNNNSGSGGSTSAVSQIGGQGGDGGGLYASGFSATHITAAISDSVFSGNTTGIGGSGSPIGVSGDGGAMSLPDGQGSYAIERSTISGNSARYGGGIYTTGAGVTITNSTIDSNTALMQGGGLYADGVQDDIDMFASTVSSNTAPNTGANVYMNGGAHKIHLERTLIADPQGISNCGGTIGDGDSLEHFPSAAFTCGTANTTTTLGLSPLADNGGPTNTRLPVVGSAAHNAIAPGSCIEASDQRGVNRPKGTGCDIGAVEIDPSIDAFDDNAATVAVAVVIDVLSNDVGTDTALDPTSVSATAGPSNGGVTFSGSTGRATYTPSSGFKGTDQFTYQVCSAGQSTFCDTATVDITVTQLPPPPPPPPAATPGVVTITPARLLETRAGLSTFDGQQQGIGRRTAKQVTTVNIAGRAGIPADADAAIINIGAINPTANGFITAYPCNKTQPGSSTLNYTAGTTIANGATIKLSPAGTICIYTHQAMDLIIDVTGYTPNIP